MEEQDLAAHISQAFNEDLQRVRAMTLQMGRMVEAQLGDAVTALVSGDTGLARRVEYDDYRVNHLEVTIDNECSGLIVR
ncbi:MAG TPA: PhoU domain-containing protein, partial [Gammaproteobacteria bacterium]|nr:PhoU domain-containing protein [Gammaproteobacteria bacterium]